MTSSLAIRHKTDQDHLAALLAAEVAPLVVPQPRRSMLRALRDTVGALTSQYAQASAAIAADFYDAAREAAGLVDGFTVPLAEPSDEQIERSLEWALQDLADIGIEVGDDVELGGTGLDATRTKVEGSATRLALAGGRDTVAGAAQADQRCTGYVRVARADACYFCAMLATRMFDLNGGIQGVYRSEESALYRGNERATLPNRGGGVRRRGVRYAAPQTYSTDSYHDNCRCSAEPIFEGQDYQPPEHVVEWNNLYSRVSGSDANGRPLYGAKKLAAFRTALAEQRRT